MVRIPRTLFRGEEAENPDLHRDGRTIFLTDNPEEALGDGPHLIEARIDVARMFQPGLLVLRAGGEWRPDEKEGADLDVSRSLHGMLVDRFGKSRADTIYHHVEGGSWSEVERPEIQEWLRSEASMASSAGRAKA